MNDLVDSLSDDLSMMFRIRHDFERPSDNYVDPVIEVFGNEPDADDLRRVYSSQIDRFSKALTDCVEFPVSNEDSKEFLRVGARNFFGPKFSFEG